MTTTDPQPDLTKDAVLAPCPFCGDDAEMDTMRGYRALSSGRIGNAAAIYCTGCSADMMFCYADAPGLSHEDIVANLVEQWNRRATAHRLNGEEEEELRREIIHRISEPSAFAGFRGDRTLAGWQADALLPMITAHIAQAEQAATEREREACLVEAHKGVPCMKMEGPDGSISYRYRHRNYEEIEAAIRARNTEKARK